MPQSLSMNLVHLICSTKNRDTSLTPAFVIGAAADNAHALFKLSNFYERYV